MRAGLIEIGKRNKRKNRPDSAHFDSEEREQVRSRSDGMCQMCGINIGAEAHHILPIHYGLHYFQKDYPGNINDLLSCAANCLWVCPECGDVVHEDELCQINYNQIFQALQIALAQGKDQIDLNIKNRMREERTIYIGATI